MYYREWFEHFGKEHLYEYYGRFNDDGSPLLPEDRIDDGGEKRFLLTKYVQFLERNTVIEDIPSN